MITQSLDSYSKHAIPTVGREFDSEVRVLSLRDGRRLAYQEFGDRRGFPLFHCHSHGSSRLEATLFDAAARRAGFRLVSMDRPGTGFSDFKPGGSPATFAQDVLALADSLDCRKFGVMAFGGGAAYALAVCQHLPDRAQLMLGISCIPPGSLGLLNDASSLMLRISSALMRVYIGLRHRLYARNPLYYLDRLRDTLCFSDRRILQSPSVLELMQKDVKESMRQGARGVAHDIIQSCAGWKFKSQTSTVPIHLWQGSADTLVSQRCAESFAESIPSSTLHRVANRGHFFFLRGMDEVFAVANAQLNGRNEQRGNLVHLPAQRVADKILARAAT